MTLMQDAASSTTGHQLTVGGLFAGIGGIELGLQRAGHHSSLLCEIDAGACRVLETRFPEVPLTPDVRELQTVGRVDLLAAGFPCQDLSQAGRTAGIGGRNSGLVGHVFRLLDALKKRGPRWLLLENVSFMLQLERGKGMRYLVDQLEERGYHWAYRVVDTRAFGLPQRRQRVILLASRDPLADPREVLLADDAGPEETPEFPDVWRGFYWTEGTRGLGWAVDAVPTLKGGSTIGIPSPPAVWIPRPRRGQAEIVTPGIHDAERLQGFPPDWTAPALEVDGVRRGHRWKLVGNAVSVSVAEWVGRMLARPRRFSREGRPLREGVLWPRAAFGSPGVRPEAVDVSMWPVQWDRPHLSDFLNHGELAPLSLKAAAGFFRRATSDEATIQPDRDFLKAVARHVESMR